MLAKVLEVEFHDAGDPPFVCDQVSRLFDWFPVHTKLREN